jgi:two-component system, NarL family, nitrate/nitrite response regulator NarL
MDRCRVILVGHSRLFLEGLSLMLEGSDLTVACTTNSVSELLPLLTAIDEQPDLIVWDSSTNLEQDLVRLAEIHREFPKIGIVALADEVDAAHVDRTLAAGVRGLLPKCISTDALRLSLQSMAFAENVAIVPFNLARSRQESSAGRSPIGASILPIRLSSREAEILERLGVGAPNKIIARELSIAEATIKVHVKALMRKINVSNRTQAAVWSQTHQFSGRGGACVQGVD